MHFTHYLVRPALDSRAEIFPEQASTESSSEDEQGSFDKTYRHFQQLRQISLDNEFKYKMDIEFKSEGRKDENHTHFTRYLVRPARQGALAQTSSLNKLLRKAAVKTNRFKTYRHFQQLRQISLDNEFKYKMEMKIKSEGRKDENHIHFTHYLVRPALDSRADIFPEQASTESSSEDEQGSFDKTYRHFQQLRQISLDNEFKYKMEMEFKSEGREDENLRNFFPFVKQVSLDIARNNFTINGDGHPYSPTTQTICPRTQLLAAFAVSMGSLIVGFSSGSSPAFKSMNLSFSGETPKSWVDGLMPLAALIGRLAGGLMIEMLGSKLTIIGTTLPFFFGWMLIANTLSVSMVFAGQALCGICVGVASLAIPVYLAETIKPELSALGLLPTAFGNTGVLLAYLAGAYLTWPQMAFVGASLTVPSFLLMISTPESPIPGSVRKGRREDACKALQWLRGKNINIDKEMRDFTHLTQLEVVSDRAGGGGLSLLFTRKYLPALCIYLGLLLFQKLTGINAVVFHAPDIFKKSGSKDQHIISIV